MPLYFYSDADTFVHRLHPVTKILGALLLFVPALASSRAELLGALVLGVLCLAAWSRALGSLRRMWRLLVLLFVFTVAIWSAVGHEGERLNATAARYGLSMAFRLEAMVCLGLVFVTVTKVEDLGEGLGRMGIPFRVSFALTLAFRLVPTFMATAHTVIDAQKCRGLDFESGGPIARMRKYVPLLVPVLISSVKRAELLALALESKGFGCGAKRTCATRYAVSWRDWCAMAFCMGLAGAALAARTVA